MFDNVLFNIFFISMLSTIFGAFAMKYFVASSKNMFISQIEFFSKISKKNLEKFDDNMSHLFQENLKLKEEFDSNFERINQNLVLFNNKLNALNSKLEHLNKLEDEVMKCKNIIKRQEKRLQNL